MSKIENSDKDGSEFTQSKCIAICFRVWFVLLLCVIPSLSNSYMTYLICEGMIILKISTNVLLSIAKFGKNKKNTLQISTSSTYPASKNIY